MSLTNILILQFYLAVCLFLPLPVTLPNFGDVYQSHTQNITVMRACVSQLLLRCKFVVSYKVHGHLNTVF